MPADPSLPEDQLLCFPDKNRPAEVVSLRKYVIDRSRAAKRDLASAPARSRGEMRKRLATLLRTRIDSATDRPVSVHESFEADGVRTTRFTVFSEPGVQLPCLMRTPIKGCKSIVIATHPDGIDACLRQKRTEASLAGDGGVCVADLRSVGLSRWGPADDRIDLYQARTALWLGRTMMGDWVTDLGALYDAVKQLTGVKKIELLGFGQVFEESPEQRSILSRGGLFGTGDTALASLLAAAVDARFHKVTVVDLLSTYVPDEEPPRRRYQVYVPSMLNWGDVSTIAAVAGLDRVEVISLVSSACKPVTKAGRTKWLGEAQRCERRLTRS
jgi:hypothetical protein